MIIGYMMCWLVFVPACTSYADHQNSDASGCTPTEVSRLNCSGPGWTGWTPIGDPDPILTSEECKGSVWDSQVCFQAYVDYVCPGDPTVASGIDFESQMVVRLWNGVCGCDPRLEPVSAEICNDWVNVYYVAYGDSWCDGCTYIFQLISLPRTDLPVHKIFQGVVDQENFLP